MGLIAYFDCPTGISGDMCLGALVSAGVPLEYLMEKLALLGLGHEYRLAAGMVQKQGQAATKVEVHLLTEPSSDRHHHGGRHLPEIEQLIKGANLPARVSRWSLAIFHQLAIAEGEVHGIEPEAVHFHEVGATDAIVDIVGTCLGLDYLGIDKCYWSALPTGSGTVRAAHGDLPVPVPAVLRLWENRQVPVYDNGLTGELVTPTGAAIAVTLANQFGTKPPFNLQKLGLGAGSKELPLANILRLWIGTESQTAKTPKEIPFGQLETITVLETQLDDLQPQAVGYLLESLLHQGAIDVFTQAIAMKKSRPGILLTVLCAPENQNHCLNLLFRETTSLGVRVRQQQRYALEREWQTVVIAHGSIRIKVAYSYQAGTKIILNAHPEFVDCAALAKATGQPWQLIHQQAIAAWSSLSKDSAQG
ncbi:nickel pincer cofactor biosynthesis protein LarC [Synechocystis salina]|uniref:Putative nickel insertion protein n=1 Tax=Synechocystis salina LEGE 00031 TaxID=1828736 RepID=A0ABR9VPE9_9SYNC|nr:nickel pincer cofactor biosynthesis protein LarC [Synechocystis salina]MBE9241528.1 nickel pincer cofactor biosynthesis protein LarC [Synechocystis salina LEGE 00041]MBE9253212.1 nickel pincer cofactor biosynthesis protein LarC [Synechocystis salina LEGE 00031]